MDGQAGPAATSLGICSVRGTEVEIQFVTDPKKIRKTAIQCLLPQSTPATSALSVPYCVELTQEM